MQHPRAATGGPRVTRAELPNCVPYYTMHALVQWSPEMRPSPRRCRNAIGSHAGGADEGGHGSTMPSSDNQQSRLVLVEDLPTRYTYTYRSFGDDLGTRGHDNA